MRHDVEICKKQTDKVNYVTEFHIPYHCSIWLEFQVFVFGYKQFLLLHQMMDLDVDSRKMVADILQRRLKETKKLAIVLYKQSVNKKGCMIASWSEPEVPMYSFAVEIGREIVSASSAQLMKS